jgi:hypothetical protein
MNDILKSGLRRILFDKSCLRHILLQTKICFSQNIFCLIILWCIWFEDSYSVYQFIRGVDDSNFNTQWLQGHNLYQAVMEKVSNYKPFVKSNLVPSEIQIALIQFQNSLSETMYVQTFNINITITELVSIGVARRCDNTVDKNRANSCALKRKGTWATKKIAQKHRKCSLRRATNVTCSKFHGWRRKTRTNSGLKILTSCFLYCWYCLALP